MNQPLTRRDWLATSGLLLGCAAATTPRPANAATSHTHASSDFRFCLNTSTIRGQNLDLADEIEITAKAGYDGIEPWMRKIIRFAESGGSLKDLQKRIRDLGLVIESAIGFANWIVDDDVKRKQGLEVAKREMGILRELGGTRIAAPPAGATRGIKLPLHVVAERYRQLLELGDQMDVIPQLEVWGFSTNLSRLGETVYVAIESAHPQACVLPDVFHLYKGGNDPNGLKLLSGTAIHAFHINDYPASPPRAEINDSHRIYPGDGVGPLTEILQTLHANGFRGALSLELFNRDYWKQDALTVAQTGLRKMRQAAAQATS